MKKVSIYQTTLKLLGFVILIFFLGLIFARDAQATCVDQNFNLICRTNAPPYEDCVYAGTDRPCRGPDAATPKCECKVVTTPPGERESGPIDFRAIINQALPTFKFKEAKIGDIISVLLPYIFALAGLILLLYLVWGGFQLMLSGGDPQKASAAKGKITSAIVGFVIIFVAYWLIQILQVIFGLPKVF